MGGIIGSKVEHKAKDQVLNVSDDRVFLWKGKLAINVALPCCKDGNGYVQREI